MSKIFYKYSFKFVITKPENHPIFISKYIYLLIILYWKIDILQYFNINIGYLFWFCSNKFGHPEFILFFRGALFFVCVLDGYQENMNTNSSMTNPRMASKNGNWDMSNFKGPLCNILIVVKKGSNVFQGLGRCPLLQESHKERNIIRKTLLLFIHEILFFLPYYCNVSYNILLLLPFVALMKRAPFWPQKCMGYISFIIKADHWN